MTTDSMTTLMNNLDTDIEMRALLEDMICRWSHTVATEHLDEFFAELRDQLAEIRANIKQTRRLAQAANSQPNTAPARGWH